jgi:hypothetical protein
MVGAHKMLGVRTTVLVVVVSLASSLMVTAGVRTVQHLSAPQLYAPVPVSVDLPHAAGHPSTLLFGMHGSPLSAGAGAVLARRDATGLVSALTQSGQLAGQAIIPTDQLLRPRAARVTYASTATALLMQTPALATNSPILAALIESEAATSPAAQRLTTLLAQEASADANYLSAPSPSLAPAMAAASAEVSSRLRQVLSPPGTTAKPAGLAAVNPRIAAAMSPMVYSSASRAALSPVTATSPTNRSRSAGTPPDRLVLYDTTGASACASHSISDALCVQSTDLKLPAPPVLAMTNWTGGWQLAFADAPTLATTGGLRLPFAALPPVVNSPPTISGLVFTAISAGSHVLITDNACRLMHAQLTGDCNNNNFVQEVGRELFGQLTLAADGTQLVMSVDQQLEHTSIGVVGSGTLASLAGSQIETAAWSADWQLTVVTQFIVPAEGLLLDLIPFGDKTGDEAAVDTAAETETTGQARGQTKQQTEEQVIKSEEDSQTVEHLPSTAAEVPAGKVKQAADAFQKARTAQDELATVQQELNVADQVFQAAKLDYQQAKAQFPAGSPQVAQAYLRQQRAADAKGPLTTAASQAQTNAETAWATAQSKSKGTTVGASLEEDAAGTFFELADAYRDVIVAAVQEFAHGQTQQGFLTLLPLIDVTVEHFGTELLELAFHNLPLTLLRFTEGAAASSVLALIPGVNILLLVVKIFDVSSTAFGLVQDLENIARTAALASVHTFPPIFGNYRQGTRDVPAMFLGAANLGDLANAVQHKPSGLLLIRTTTVCPNTVIVPLAPLQGRHVGILNTSDAVDLHFAAGFGGIAATESLAQAVDFAAVHTSTPLGAGGVAFADPPAVGQPVTVTDEGNGVTRSFTGVMQDEITSGGQVIAFTVSAPSSVALSSTARYVGGFVMATIHGQPQLVGLAELEQNGSLVALAGPGVDDLVSRVADCQGAE